MNDMNETSEEIAIKVEGVYKDFDLPHEKQNNLKQKIIHPFKSKPTVEKQHALKDISFEVKKGEFFGIVGRNGSGKSTLLKILAEIYTPTKGRVTVNGSLTPFIELGVGFNADLTGRENVYLNGAMLGFSTKEMEKMYDEIVEFAELEKFMDQKLKNYSSGMQVRLAFSVAIRAKSDILLLDEVLAVGDADFQRKCYDYFKTLKKNRQTVILVTHDMNAVKEYCDRAMLIERSELTKIGDNEKVANSYTKLFQKEENQAGENTESNRNGDKSIEITETEIKVEKKTIKITVGSKVNKSVTDPLFGFKLKDASGHGILGTNNRIKKIRIAKLDKGRSLKTTWMFENLLNPGKYFVDIAILDSDGLTPYDIWEDSHTFRINKEEWTPYPISPEITLDNKVE
jgi:ABC-2 type transport system ATP-binding protein